MSPKTIINVLFCLTIFSSCSSYQKEYPQYQDQFGVKFVENCDDFVKRMDYAKSWDDEVKSVSITDQKQLETTKLTIPAFRESYKSNFKIQSCLKLGNTLIGERYLEKYVAETKLSQKETFVKFCLNPFKPSTDPRLEISIIDMSAYGVDEEMLEHPEMEERFFITILECIPKGANVSISEGFKLEAKEKNDRVYSYISSNEVCDATNVHRIAVLNNNVIILRWYRMGTSKINKGMIDLISSLDLSDLVSEKTNY